MYVCSNLDYLILAFKIAGWQTCHLYNAWNCLTSSDCLRMGESQWVAIQLSIKIGHYHSFVRERILTGFCYDRTFGVFINFFHTFYCIFNTIRNEKIHFFVSSRLRRRQIPRPLMGTLSSFRQIDLLLSFKRPFVFFRHYRKMIIDQTIMGSPRLDTN